jgi:CheY-like chemotaxis protein
MLTNTPLLLFAEDDDEDWMLIEDSFDECNSPNRLERVRDGVELLDRLRDLSSPQPDLVLLDLKMPRMGGHEALSEIRQDPRLSHIPVVIMTASRSDTDILRGYQGGCNSYIPKPVTSIDLRTIKRYWGGVVVLPRV